MEEELKDTNRQVRDSWNQKAAFWDELQGEEGNRFQRRLVLPAIERLLDLQSGERVLDIACGNGVTSRRLAALGGLVTGVDFSEALLAKAQARNRAHNEPVVYQVADATDEAALLALGEGQFEAVVCTMALMDIPIIDPLFRAARRLLAPGGRFVFATSHPAFNSNSPVFVAEMADVEGELVTTHALKISQYIEGFRQLAVGARNEPVPHYYFHRPLQELLGAGFAAGFVLDGLEEPVFGPEDAQDARMLSWYRVWRIPPVLAGRLR